MTHSPSIVIVEWRGNLLGTKTALISLLLSLLLGLNVGADQEIRLNLEENGGLFLPNGFEAQALINQLDGQVRHIAVNDNGDVYVKLRQAYEEYGNAVLRDTDG